MKQMKMSVKIYAVMAILVVVAIVVAVVGVTYLSSLNQNLNNIVNGSAEKVKLGARLQQDLLAIHRAEKNIILANNQERMDEYAANIEAQRKEMEDRRETLRELVDDQGKRDLDEFAKTWDAFLKANAEVRRLARLNSNNKAADLSSGKGREAYEACEQIMKAIADANDKAVSQTAERTDLEPAAKTAEMDKAASRALLSARVIQDMLEIHRAEKNVILSKTQEEMDEYAAATDTLLADMKGRLGELNKLATEEGKAQLLEFQKAWDHFVALNRQVRETSRENGNARAFALSTGKGRELADKAEEQLRAIVERNEQEMAADAKASDEAAATAKYTMILLSAIGILLASAVAYLVLNGINKRLLQVVQGLAEGAEQTASASGQISAASQQLAEGATEQAASLEETSSALEEIASQTRQNADNANQADTSMKDTRGQVEKGGQAVQNMTSAMQEISESSDETSKIIKTIEEIAFQTNLLALNAAVEAARAGDAGKGFAVVADEVRNLAQRSAQAARDTSELIEGTVSRVKNGAQLVEELQASFKEIEESSSKVANLVNEITSASDEQAQGVDQVNTAVAQMDKVTQTNAANAEESASASEELNAQADQLNTMVGTLTEIVQGRNGNGHISRRLSAPSRNVQSRGAARQLSSSSRGDGNGGEKNLPAKQREEPKVVKPNDVIPLEDDEDFSEF